ncbi:hypothetical protein NHX12_004288 [Muraenolepis orangiensis]|uniref:Reverse transcriptase domain-containing protein n=1 Tax=Muraenolepis orangiensis TaxID=630683 RepID=A0A9Q0DV71_9TELE|nr:hypothetical protein NHX12_004288 [Muraenolepis orangiensis]
MDFLTGRPQVVKIGNISSTLVLNTAAPQGCCLSPRLYTHDCTATHSNNCIIKFADDTTVIGLISEGDETEYRDEVVQLTPWCEGKQPRTECQQDQDFWSHRGPHSTISLDGSMVEVVSCFRFLGLQISDDLAWTRNTECLYVGSGQERGAVQLISPVGILKEILTDPTNTLWVTWVSVLPDQRVPAPDWTSRLDQQAGPACTSPRLDQRVPAPDWTSRLDQRVPAPDWTSRPDQRVPAPDWTSRLDQRVPAPD